MDHLILGTSRSTAPRNRTQTYPPPPVQPPPNGLNIHVNLQLVQQHILCKTCRNNSNRPSSEPVAQPSDSQLSHASNSLKASEFTTTPLILGIRKDNVCERAWFGPGAYKQLTVSDPPDSPTFYTMMDFDEHASTVDGRCHPDGRVQHAQSP